MSHRKFKTIELNQSTLEFAVLTNVLFKWGTG